MCPEVTARLYRAWLYIMSAVLCTHQGSGCFLHIQNEFAYISSVMDSLHGLLHLKERSLLIIFSHTLGEAWIPPFQNQQHV